MGYRKCRDEEPQMPRIVNIHITAKSIVLLLAAAAVIWLLVAFNQVLLILFLAILLAVAITPLVGRLERGMPRAIAILVIYAILLGILSAAVGLLVPLLIEEFGQLSATLPRTIENILTLPERWIAPLLGRSLPASNISQSLNDQIAAFVGGIGGLLVALGKTLTTVVLNALIVLVIGYFLTSDAQFAPRFIARFFPPAYRAHAAALAREIGARLGHWVRAQLLVGLFYGVTFGIGLWLIGVPYAFSLGMAGAILELIPYVGGAIVTTVAMLVALSISPWLALGVLGLELAIASVESHIIYPKLVGDIVGLHPLVTIIALFIGAEAKGVIGAVLAIPLAIVLQVLFEQFYRFEERQETAVSSVPAPNMPVRATNGADRIQNARQR
jgi:predicted PurR-regulated permease PerM